MPAELLEKIKQLAEEFVGREYKDIYEHMPRTFGEDSYIAGAAAMVELLAAREEGHGPHVRFAKTRLTGRADLPNNMDTPPHRGEMLPSVAEHFIEYIPVTELQSLTARFEAERAGLKNGLRTEKQRGDEWYKHCQVADEQLAAEREKVAALGEENARLRDGLKKISKEAHRWSGTDQAYKMGKWADEALKGEVMSNPTPSPSGSLPLDAEKKAPSAPEIKELEEQAEEPRLTEEYCAALSQAAVLKARVEELKADRDCWEKQAWARTEEALRQGKIADIAISHLALSEAEVGRLKEQVTLLEEENKRLKEIEWRYQDLSK
jgi:hypothetical protein